VADRAAGHSDHQPAAVHLVGIAAGAVPDLCGFVDELVERRVDVVCELHLGDHLAALTCGADGEADETLFAERGVEHARVGECGCEVSCAAKHSAERDVFAEDEQVGVGGERVGKGGIDGLVEVLTGCC